MHRAPYSRRLASQALMVSPSFVTILAPWFKRWLRILDDEPVQDSPRRHDTTRQRKQAPLPPDSPQKRGADSGPLVWVRVTRSGKLAPNGERGDNEGEVEGSYWWPASVRKSNIFSSWP